MSYSSPTIIYKLDLLKGFVSVCDVGGTYAVQIYKEHSSGVTSLLHSEVWDDSLEAKACADTIRALEVDNWWNGQCDPANWRNQKGADWG